MSQNKNDKNAVDTVIHEIEKRFGKGAVQRMNGSEQRTVEHVPSGIVQLDRALGIGGLPKGRIVEIYGPEASGKTTLTLQFIAQAQKKGITCGFIDAEHALDPSYASALGVRVEELLVSQPDSGEQGLDICEILARCGQVGFIVVDSVAALTPRAEIDGSMGDQHVGLQARLMSQALRKLTAAAHRTGTTVVFINQLRHKIGVTFGSPETTTGGNALKFYASMRLDVRRIGAIKDKDAVIGNRTRIKVVKNKMAPPFRRAELDLYYGLGLCPAADLLDMALEAGVMAKRGAYYKLGDETLGLGREAARRALLDKPELFERLRAAVLGEDVDGAEPETPGAGESGAGRSVSAAATGDRKAA